jgi:hypothetical protein
MRECLAFTNATVHDGSLRLSTSDTAEARVGSGVLGDVRSNGNIQRMMESIVFWPGVPDCKATYAGISMQGSMAGKASTNVDSGLTQV